MAAIETDLFFLVAESNSRAVMGDEVGQIEPKGEAIGLGTKPMSSTSPLLLPHRIGDHDGLLGWRLRMQIPGELG